jgi:hypothetical protein
LDVGEEGLGILEGRAGAGEEMPLESGKRLAPDENGGALAEIRRCQLVAAEDIATKQVDGLALEETGLDLGAKVNLCALAVVLGVLAAEPGGRLVGVDLG